MILCNINIISYGGFKYVVSPSPNPSSICDYKDFLLSNGVTTIVKLCKEKLYDDSDNIIDIPLEDGATPDEQTIKRWVEIIKNEKKVRSGIAVHCVSGLGRAPLFVCVGLIKVEKMNALDAVALVRSKIPHALNSRQLKFVFNLKYKKNLCCVM